ncbi:MAG: nucleoside-diphosphate sugar epimerase/dehydratase [Roseiflexaceae bacterium]
MRRLIRNRYFFGSDLVLLPVAVYLSFVLRLDDPFVTNFMPGMVLFMGISMVVTLVIFQAMRMYSRYWRFASIDELVLLGSSVTGAAILTGIIALAANQYLPSSFVIPRSVPFIYTLLALLVTAGPRLAIRLISRHRPQPVTGNRIPVMIMGAGSAGSMMLRELRANPQVGMDVIGFVDDDPAKRGMSIQGVAVLGAKEDIPMLVAKHSIQQIVIAMPTASGKAIREVKSICEQCNVRPRIIPGIYELLDGKVSINQIRDVQIEDLLRRKPIRTNTTAVGELIQGRRVLITGAGGSIGSELCRQVLRFAPSEMILLGHGENSIFTIENELRKILPPETTLKAVIADIRFAERVRSVFNECKPEIVFHAAAHKHVPLMEANPAEAVTNNILGTRNLLQAAQAVDVDQFVMISTDKAVNPTSIMGTSKRIAELLVHQAAKMSGKPYVAVRFGNVLGSRGSVVLTFKQQIAAGGPITVTHPEMVRFFMTIPEAVQLTLQAATLGRGGEVFTLDMGEPVKIVDLARDMIELSGLEVGRDIDIAFSGMRPGEKLYEELFVPGEDYKRTIHEKIFIACNASTLVPRTLTESIASLELAAYRGDTQMILRLFQSLVPQMRRPGSDPQPSTPQVAAVDDSTQPLLVRAVGS